MGIQVEIDGVAMSPGRTFVFGLVKGKPVFSLPGSPTAAIVAFEELVRPSLLKMRGIRADRILTRPSVKMNLGQKVRGRRGLSTYVLARVVVKDGRLIAIPLRKEHRGALTPAVTANGIVVLPEGRTEVNRGEEVTVRVFDLDFQPERCMRLHHSG
jgi:molybdopterin molybdotransferase